jgi:hypothetical protein
MVKREQLSQETDLPFETIRVTHSGEVPPPEERAIDIALLDMNHAWRNMGHDSLIQAVRETAVPFRPFLASAALRIRVFSFDIRKSLALPAPGRFLLYIGTGGPGHIDPHQNDGAAFYSQGIVENSAWEEPLHLLLDTIRDDERSSLIAVCHTFGLLCRWAGVAEPVLRSDEKGGKSVGVRENLLTDDAVAHPYFSRFSRELPDGRRFRVVDSRLFDLIPISSRPPAGMTMIATEMDSVSGAAGQAVTAVEFARDRDGVMPRILGVNHHPEVIDREHALEVLHAILKRGEVSPEWYAERADTLTQQIEGGDTEILLRLTSQYTLLLPLQFQLARLIRERREQLGLKGNFHEEQLLRDFTEAEEEVSV